jgi:biotin operon repressor
MLPIHVRREIWINGVGVLLPPEVVARGGLKLCLFPPRSMAKAAPPLTSEDMTVLRVLAERHPRTMKQVELEAATGLSRKTVCARLKYLRSWGLVRRPFGSRKGDGLTDLGLQFARRL